MVTTSVFGLSWIFLLLAGGAGGFPPVGAPLPLDPTLSAIAPEECLWYASSAGFGAPDGASANETEKLLAEPQVQRLFAEIEKHLMAVVRRAGGPNREQRVLATEAPKIVMALLSRPVAAYVEDVQPGPSNSVRAEAAFVLNAGDAKEELTGALRELQTLATEKGLSITSESAGGVEWQRIALPPQAPPVRVGWKDSYFIIAVGEATPAKILGRMNGEAGRGPQWLAQVRDEHPIERELTLGYVNVDGILKRVKPLVDAQNAEMWPIVERLGLTSIRALHGVTGFDDIGCRSTAHIVTDGKRTGLLAFMPHEPLAADDFALIPKDALIAAAVRLNVRETVEQAIALVGSFEPRAKEDFERHMWEVETQLGVNPLEDILGSLDNAWVAYLPAGDLMSSWLNAGAAVRVKDAGKLRTAVAKLVDFAKTEMAQHNERATIAATQVDGQTIYSLQFTGEPVPFSPSWCISDDWAVFGLMPSSVRGALDRDADDSLAHSQALAEPLAANVAPAAVVYQDTPQLVRAVYPFVQLGVTMISGPLRQQGIEIDPTALPSAETIIKHLRPTVATLGHADDGFHMTSRGSLPGGGNSIGAAPIIVALLLPAVQAARQAVRDAQEINNMRQIALAALNYESARGELPKDVYGADGKPLLSWRVRLLPYMEENVMAQQFKMDEPWDSAHNRALLENMPAVFASATGPEMPGRTRILGFKGDATMFPGDQKLGFAAIRDGTSLTVFFVEAGPQAAVEWTRPADIEYNAEKPFAGLEQPAGYFLAAFVDGSVRKLSLGLADATMKALVTRAGQEVIEYDSLDATPAPWMYQQLMQSPSEPAGVPR